MIRLVVGLAPLFLLWSPSARADDVQAPIVHPWALIQTWATLYDQDESDQADPASYGDPEHDPGFTLERARVGLDGTLPTPPHLNDTAVRYAFTVGTSAPYDAPSEAFAPTSTSVKIVDANVGAVHDWGFGRTEVTVGQQVVPADRESMMASENLVFTQRAVNTNWLTPYRDVGVEAGQSVDFGADDLPGTVKLSGGVFNGNDDLFGSNDGGLLYAVRLEGGVGHTYRTWSPKKKPGFGAGLSYVSDNTFATSQSTMGADLLARVWLISLLASGQMQTVSPTADAVVPPDVLAETQRRGAMAQLSFWIPIQDEQGVEIAGRYALFDDNADLVDNGDVAILDAGATWRNVLPAVDLGAGYVHRGEAPDAVAIDNDTIRMWVSLRPTL